MQERCTDAQLLDTLSLGIQPVMMEPPFWQAPSGPLGLLLGLLLFQTAVSDAALLGIGERDRHAGEGPGHGIP